METRRLLSVPLVCQSQNSVAILHARAAKKVVTNAEVMQLAVVVHRHVAVEMINVNNK